MSFDKVLQECDELLTTSGVLGRLEDGMYECAIVRIDRTNKGYDVTLKHGNHILTESMPKRSYADLQWATGFSRPAGGTCVVRIAQGHIVEVGKDGN